jgi:probable HAF family extracellular repeat protein
VLPALEGASFSEALVINDAGQIAGFSGDRAVLWEHGTVRGLGTLGGSFARVTDINERGDVVGFGETATGEVHAFVWRAGVMTDLGTLDGDLTSRAEGINDAGQIVGTSHDASGRNRAFVWEDGAMTALEALPGFRLSSASAINDRGQIVGRSSGPAGPVPMTFTRATLWTVPVPPGGGVPPDEPPPEPEAPVARPWKGKCKIDEEQVSATEMRMSGTCTLSHMGRTRYETLHTLVAGSATEFTSATTYTAANGDLLRTVGAGSSTARDGTRRDLEAVETVVGGTGRFTRASGTATLSGTTKAKKKGASTGSYELAGTLRYAASDRDR